MRGTRFPVITNRQLRLLESHFVPPTSTGPSNMAGSRKLSRTAVLCMALATAPPVFARGGIGRGATINSNLDESTPGSITFAFLVIFAIACLLQTCNVSVLIFRRRSMNHTHLNATPFLSLLLLGTISLSSSYILGAVIIPSFYSSTRLNPIVPTMWTFTDRLGSLLMYGGILLILEELISNLAPEPILPRMPLCALGRNRIRRVVGAVLFSLMVMAIFAPVAIHMASSNGEKSRRGKMYRTFGAVYVVTYILLAIHNLLSSTHLLMFSREVKSDMAEDHVDKIQVRTWSRTTFFKLTTHNFCHVRSYRFLRLGFARCL